MAAAARTAGIELPPLNIQTLKLTLIGDSPLIVHAWSPKALKQMADKQQKKATAGREAKDPWADFCGSMYWLSDRPDKPTEADVEAARFGFVSPRLAVATPMRHPTMTTPAHPALRPTRCRLSFIAPVC